jgi:hypothetical protein
MEALLALFTVFLTIAFLAGRWTATLNRRSDDQALDDLLVPIKGLTLGRLISPSACAGCGHAIYELVGHPFWNTTCSNPACGGNHVARGNRSKRASVRAERPPNV